MDNLYCVVKKSGNVVVSIMKSKEDGWFRFVNLTKGHICSCCFKTVEEAVWDMEQKKKNGEIRYYFKIQ